MANVTTTGQLVPTDALLDTYPTHTDTYGKGGYRCVADATERNAIPAPRCKHGMRAYLQDENLEYVLSDDLVTWTACTEPTGKTLARKSLLLAGRDRLAQVKSSYLTPADGVPSFGSSSDTSCLSMGNRTRISRDMPVVEAVQFYYKTGLADVTNFSLQAWRKVGSHYYLVGSTENIINRITEESLNTIELARPITNVKRGDYQGWSFSVTGLTLPLIPDSGADLRTLANVTATLTDDMWLTPGVTFPNQAIAMQFLGRPADGCAIGDSLTAGYPGTNSLLQPTTGGSFDTFDETAQYTYYVESLLGLNIDNLGVNGNTSTQVAARLAADCIARKPRFCIVCMGTNDIPGIGSGGSYAPIITNYTTVINALLAANIWPICVGIPPRTDWCAPATYWASQMRRNVNNALETLIETNYQHRVLYINLDSTLGEYYAAGDPGNLDKLQAAYNADGVHLTTAGYTAWGNKVGADMLADLY